MWPYNLLYNIAYSFYSSYFQSKLIFTKSTNLIYFISVTTLNIILDVTLQIVLSILLSIFENQKLEVLYLRSIKLGQFLKLVSFIVNNNNIYL